MGSLPKCAAILAEAAKVLHREKIRRYWERAGKDAAGKVPEGPAAVCRTGAREGRSQGAMRRPADEKFLAAVLETGASFVVTGERHLLELGALRE